MVTLDGATLRCGDVAAVAREKARALLGERARRQVRRARRALEEIARGAPVAYGIKTGLGQLEDVTIPARDQRRLQENLVRSHAVGVGAPMPPEWVRAAMLARANAFAKGHSGVREDVVDLLLGMLNAGVHPVVPSQGSLGASGDLAPLAHLALVLIGEGRAQVRGRVRPGKEALRAARLRPLRLEAKEGLALVNGTSFMAGIGSLLAVDAQRLVRDAQIVASLSFEALRGSPVPFDARLAAVKAHPGQARVAANLRRLLRGSQIIPSHRGPHKVQDAYTLRCLPQVLGAVADVVDRLEACVTVELNAASDNPLIFPDDAESLSGGNFHGQALAMELDHAALALTVMAGFSERRIARLVDAHLSGLPPFLTERPGLNSGFMLAQYTAAALASECKVLAHPASADSIPTSANQEDWVNNGLVAARKATTCLENATAVVAIELLCAAQGLEFLPGKRPGRGPEAARDRLRKAVPALGEDRELAPDIEAARRLLVTGEISKAAARAAGPLA